MSAWTAEDTTHGWVVEFRVVQYEGQAKTLLKELGNITQPFQQSVPTLSVDYHLCVFPPNNRGVEYRPPFLGWANRGGGSQRSVLALTVESTG